MKVLQKVMQFLSSAGGTFLLGGLIGLVFFATFFGLSLVNPTATDWIWHGATHDTAQHFLGWEFFRADSDGAVIAGLAYPVGLPLTFMDAIPLLALPINLFAEVLPANFQYFGFWALLCYVLQGAITAVLVRKVWQKIYEKNNNKAIASAVKQSSKNVSSRLPRQMNLPRNDAGVKSIWQILFVAAGALIFVLSPIMIARTLYHPALAAQWLVLLGILLIWDAAKFAKLWKFIAVWSAMLIGAVLIHPYFLPMLGAMMLVSGIKNYELEISKKKISFLKKYRENWQKITLSLLKFFAKVFVPVSLAGVVFAAIGGFALGSGSEIHDLHEKGFNLLSFANPSGYSLIPGFANASSSPETMMWLGLGVWSMIVAAAILWRGNYKKSFREFRAKFAANKTRNTMITISAVGLLLFAIGIRIDFGPITLFQYSVPGKIYEIWSAFRAAAREAWPFYYALILAAIYWFGRAIQLGFTSKSDKSNNVKNVKKGKKSAANLKKNSYKKSLAIAAASLFLISIVQFADIWFSEKAMNRREGFAAARSSAPEFTTPEIADLVTTQQNLVALDADFRGDMTGFYKIGRAALQNNLTLNVGFFARVPDEIWAQQTAWREKILHGKLTTHDLKENIFFTKDEETIDRAGEKYAIEKRGDFYFITARN